jgi:ABC-type uncharacterized transport system involved in gliding motility auxiliary subunit
MRAAGEGSGRLPRYTSGRWHPWAGLAASVTLLLAILVVVQVMAERHNVRIDLTPSRRLSLADTTRQILDELEGPLRIEAYHARGERQNVADLLARLADASPHVEYELFDLDRYPERARAAGVRDPDRARLTYGDVHTVVSTAREEYLAGGILRTLRGRPRDIYFVVGHGERTPANPTTAASLSILAAALRAENARARPLDLAASGTVPDDAAALVLAGPATDLLPGEIDALRAYLARGGAVLALLDPVSLPRLAGLLADLGIRLGDDVILDRARVLGTEPLVVRVPYYRMHPVTAPMDAPAVLAGARTVEGVDGVGLRVQAVARTTESSWATSEVDSARRGEANFREDRDQAGPLPVMVAATFEGSHGGGGRLVVIGDVDLATDGYIDQSGNRDLLLNSLSWLTDEEALIARRPRDIAEIARPLSPLLLTERQADALFIGMVIGQPALMLLIGAVFVSVRRRRG